MGRVASNLAVGVRLAFAVGEGTPIVQAPHWLSSLQLSSLQYDLNGPLSRAFHLPMTNRHRLIVHDARGIRLSDRDLVRDISCAAWVRDLECVVDAADLDGFVLFGQSHGCAIASSSRRGIPSASRLILHGRFATPLFAKDGDPTAGEERLRFAREMIRQGWGTPHDAYRRWFTSTFIPGGTREQFDWFNEAERNAGNSETAEGFLETAARVDVSARLAEVRHRRCGDRRRPLPARDLADAAPRVGPNTRNAVAHVRAHSTRRSRDVSWLPELHQWSLVVVEIANSGWRSPTRGLKRTDQAPGQPAFSRAASAASAGGRSARHSRALKRIPVTASASSEQR